MSEIRVARADDGAGVAAIYDPIVRDTAISFEVDPPGEAEMRRRIVATLDAHPWLVCVDGKEADERSADAQRGVAERRSHRPAERRPGARARASSGREGPARRSRVRGYVYASRHHERAAYRWSADVTVYVREDSRGRGVGTALYTALLALLARQGYRQAYAGITLPNAGSVALHESQGFRRIGVFEDVGWKLGAWHSVGYWGRELVPAAAVPPEPLPFAKLRHDPALADLLARGAATLSRP
ncbi:MAG TPA: GNAT family N-acetyltransferase [Myxococcota bacterium]|nr:GNAT family N-acetyltransferase [Myxococcota bacterium]